MPSCWVLSSTKTERIITVPGSPGTGCPPHLHPRFSRLSQLQPSISSKDLVPNLPASHTARDCTALGSFDVRSRETSHRPACMRLASITSLVGKELCSSAHTAATRTNALAQWSSRIDTAKAFKAVVERPRKVAAFAAGEQSQGLSRSRRADSKEEPFLAATQRLDSLLSGVGDGTEELAEQLLEAESSERKVLLAALAGCCVSAAATVICCLVHNDPLGGASFSVESLQHATLGLTAAAPVAGAKLLGWSAEGHRALPLLEEVHSNQARRMQPLFAGMTSLQAATVVATEVVSSVLLLFPAAQGSLTLLLHTYGNRLKELGWEMPEGADYLLALALLAGLNGLGRVSDHAPSQQEIEVVGNAVSNAERYYKLVSSEAERMSAAFVLTAEAWVEQRVNAGIASAALASLEILFLGGLWWWTHDLATPMAAALLSYGVDFAGMYHQWAPARSE